VVVMADMDTGTAITIITVRPSRLHRTVLEAAHSISV
jgi:hypothetical protein